MVKKYMWVTTQKEGIHRYPDAEHNEKLATGDWDDVSFLAYPHRHIFHFKVKIEVFHDDRDIEFIQLKRKIEKWLGDGILKLDFKSCEMMSNDLYDLLKVEYPNRDMVISVSEDGENGSEIIYDKDLHH